MIVLRILRQGIILDVLGGPDVVTKILIRPLLCGVYSARLDLDSWSERASMLGEPECLDVPLSEAPSSTWSAAYGMGDVPRTWGLDDSDLTQAPEGSGPDPGSLGVLVKGSFF